VLLVSEGNQQTAIIGKIPGLFSSGTAGPVRCPRKTGPAEGVLQAVGACDVMQAVVMHWQRPPSHSYLSKREMLGMILNSPMSVRHRQYSEHV
jgi:hypothetical protein